MENNTMVTTTAVTEAAKSAEKVMKTMTTGQLVAGGTGLVAGGAVLGVGLVYGIKALRGWLNGRKAKKNVNTKDKTPDEETKETETEK